jgi:endonuclease/exonuclease/phosphatase family metal-dependent hydrolase
MSYNVHGGKGLDGVRDYSRIHSLMMQQKIDIALLQEFECRAAKGGSKKDVKALHVDPYTHMMSAPTFNSGEGWYGNMVISRFPIVGKDIHDITIDGKEPRNVMDLRIKIPRIGVVRFFNPHFGLSVGERVQQYNKLLLLIEKVKDMDTPIIMAGDINEWRPYSGIVRGFNKILHPVPGGGTYPARFPRAHLDRMWCYPGRLIERAIPLRNNETSRFSDHLPLVAHLKHTERLIK